MRLFSTEMVSRYHPDKYADQISDAILTAVLKDDPKAHVACEAMCKGASVIIAGEITTTADVDYEAIVRRVGSGLNYKVDSVVNLISTQSTEIGDAVGSDADMGAGDQGMMFGFAENGGKYFLPYGQEVAIDIIKAIEDDVAGNPLSILKGDAKTQVTTDLDVPGYVKPVETMLVSVCHKAGVGLGEVQAYVKNLLVSNRIPEAGRLMVNPAGTWTFGGPSADCGLTGRKIVCDQYGGYAPVGGGAFSGKDPSKVDRSGSYMARRIAVDMVRKHGLRDCTVQLAYAIGVSRPVSVSVLGVEEGGGVLQLAEEVRAAYNLTPRGIIERLGLAYMDYGEMAGGNHMLRFV